MNLGAQPKASVGVVLKLYAAFLFQGDNVDNRIDKDESWVCPNSPLVLCSLIDEKL